MNKIMLLVLVLGSCKLHHSNTEGNSQIQNKKSQEIETTVYNEVSNFLKPPYTSLSGAIYVNGMSYQFHFGKLINEEKADNRTIYEIGSITKTYTGLLLSQAVFDKKVALDDDIRIYLDGDYPNLILNSNRPITLRHLITHTSGLPLVINCGDDLTIVEKISCFEGFTKDDFFNELNHITLSDHSGVKYQYSGVGIQLVGYILERAYQKSFQELFEDYLFSRCGEQITFSVGLGNGNSNISIGKDNAGVSMPLINGFYTYSGGAKSSTASMLKYIEMFLESDDPVVKQSMELLAGDYQYGRAFAWNTYNFDQMRKMLYHNGSTFGHSSWIALYPNQKTGIFLVTNVLTNNSQGDLNELSNRIIDKLIE